MTGSIKMRPLGLMIVAFVFCMALVGCGGGAVTKENYDKVTDDMAIADVEKILGKGTELKGADMKKMTGIDVPEMPGIKFVKWGDDSKYIVVTFVNDKVKNKDKKGI